MSTANYNADEVNLINIQDLLSKTKLEDADIILLQDSENTKTVKFSDFRDSLISDDDNPSKHKLFSSYYISEALQNFNDALEKDFGQISNGLKYIEEHYVTTKKLEETVKDIEENVPGLVDIDKIYDALEEKRDKKVSITCDDLDTSEDAKKIQLANLSYEVISTMVGTTPIKTATVPDGGWVQEDIANKAIVATKLAQQYRFRGHYPEGRINQFIDDGLYLLGASVEGLPVENEDDDPEPRLMEVYNFGPDKNIIQRVYYLEDKDDETRPYFERKCLLSRIAITDFIKVYPVTDKYKIHRNMITDDFLNAGSSDDITDVFKLTKDNDYYIKKGTKNLPNDQYDFVVSVRNYGDRIEYQAKSVTLERCEIFICNGYYTSSHGKAYTQWYNITSTSLSKFEGKTLHLFGDGICYGLGSTDIPSKSYPALLTSRYGIKINNHALGDATVGNYEDDTLAERSILQQISTATIDGNNAYGIIWAGSNDYKNILTVMGENTSDNDRTFKGSLNLAIKNILEKNPKIKLMIVSPIYRARLDADDLRDSDDTVIKNYTLKDYVSAMKEIAELNHIPFVDLYNTSMIGKNTFTTYLSNRLHLSDAGHDMIADRIYDAMCYYY